MRRLRVPTVCAGLAAALLTSCSGPQGGATDEPREPRDELGLHDGQFCPPELPPTRADVDPSYSESAATELPTLAPATEGRLCTYGPVDRETRPTEVARFAWVLEGAPRVLTPDEISTTLDNLDDLGLYVDDDLTCYADLGARFLLSLAWERDLTGVVVEDYGCATVSVTDDPFVTPAGESTRAGSVTGYLDGPVALLADLGVGRGR